MISKLIDIVSNDIQIAKKQNKFIVVTIAQTQNVHNNYLNPIRLWKDLFITGFVLDSTSNALKVADAIKGNVDLLFVDIEKKLGPVWTGNEVDSRNFFNPIVDLVGINKCYPIWPNRITVDQVLHDVASLVLKKRNIHIGVVGLGYIGSSIAKELVNMGAHVVALPRNVGTKEIIVESSINLCKPSGTISSLQLVNTLEKLALSTEAVIFCANSVGIVNDNNIGLFKEHLLLMDVGKKNIRLSEGHEHKCARWLDVTGSLVQYIHSISEKHRTKFVDINLNGRHVIAGEVGRPGDVIWTAAHNYLHPFGEIDSSGMFVRYSLKKIIDFNKQ